jgi:nucleoside-diphosphate-sugar epimerase
MRKEDDYLDILLTGATGFVGLSVLANLGEHRVVTLGRTTVHSSNRHFRVEMDKNSDYSDCLTGVDCIIHCAARVHIIQDHSAKSLEEFRRTNVDATLNLARQAAQAGVKRFIFISSIKVNGEQTLDGRPFEADDTPAPQDAYGISKYEAEEGLLKLAKQSSMEVVIIRPPLVYGPNVKGNFASVIAWLKKGIPMPFGAIDNKRSLLAVDNLVSFILLCSDLKKSPNAANKVFLLSDGDDVSTTTLLRKVAKAYGTRSCLLPVPVLLMRLAAKVIGKSDFADRLFGDLQVDSSKARELLGWKPTVTMDEQLKKMAELDKSVV